MLNSELLRTGERSISTKSNGLIKVHNDSSVIFFKGTLPYIITIYLIEMKMQICKKLPKLCNSVYQGWELKN